VTITSGQSRSWDFSRSSVCRNNIFWNSTFAGNSDFSGATIDHNFSNGTISGANSISAGSNPFVNLSARDYHILGAISSILPRDKGIAIQNVAPFNFQYDMQNLIRGADGAWDMGAFEFGAVSTNAVISVSTNSLAFGTIAAGTTKDMTMSVQNVGGGTLSGSVAVGSPFAIVSGGTYNLTSGQSQTVTIRYSPTVAGTINASAAFTGGGGASVALSGTANDPSTTPIISLSTNSLNFGSVTVGGAKDLNILVQNTGGGTLSGIATASAPFSILAGGSYNLGQGQSQTVTVRFTPSSATTVSSPINFTGGGGASIQVTGSGVATASGLSFASTSGSISSPFIVNGDFIYQDSETGLADGGRAVYGFNLGTSGDYAISINVNAPDDASNSLFVNVDADPTDPAMVWDVLPTTQGPENRLVGWRGNGTFDAPEFPIKSFTLTAGAHQLIIIGREANTQIGQITLVAIPKPPQNLRITFAQ